jgi:hypothetical protein
MAAGADIAEDGGTVAVGDTADILAASGIIKAFVFYALIKIHRA